VDSTVGRHVVDHDQRRRITAAGPASALLELVVRLPRARSLPRDAELPRSQRAGAPMTQPDGQTVCRGLVGARIFGAERAQNEIEVLVSGTAIDEVGGGSCAEIPPQNRAAHRRVRNGIRGARRVPRSCPRLSGRLVAGMARRHQDDQHQCVSGGPTHRRATDRDHHDRPLTRRVSAASGSDCAPWPNARSRPECALRPCS
jgi:hypothetical protein